MNDDKPAGLNPYPDDPDAAADFQRWLGWGLMAQNMTQEDGKELIDGFLDGLKSGFRENGVELQFEPEPAKPWWRRLLRR